MYLIPSFFPLIIINPGLNFLPIIVCQNLIFLSELSNFIKAKFYNWYMFFIP